MTDPSEALASAKATADRLVKAKRFNACLTPVRELRKALVTQAQAAHPSGVLYGMPVAVKDNICTLEFTTTCGSKILEGYRSPYEATAVAKLKAAGALIAGKTNCDEFAIGSFTEHSAYGRTVQPFDNTRAPVLGRAVRCPSRHRCAASSESSPPTGASPAGGWWRSAPRSTRSASWAGASTTRRACCR